MPADPAKTSLPDLTLDELRSVLAVAMLPHVPFDGWSNASVTAGARDAGIDADVARLVFSGSGDMVDAYTALADSRMAEACSTPAFAALKIREKVTFAIRARLDAAEAEREAVRRALSVLALPTNAALSAQLLWRTADRIWRLCGDTATDFNHYSKRTLAGGVYAATLLYWLADESEGRAATWAFLDRRIAGVMRIEKVKARVANADGFSLTRFLGRLRYPAR